jgi:sialic acid synthase SpsE
MANSVASLFSQQNPLIIAELGTSHNGDPAKAKEMVAAAAEAGAGCVKLQWVIADEILHPNTGEVELPGGKIRLYDRFKQLESPPEFYAEIKEYAESKGLLFLCTPFGLKSAALLRELKPQIVKIASPELNYTALLLEIARWGLPILLSCGVSRLGDIEEAVKIVMGNDREQRAESKEQLAMSNEQLTINNEQLAMSREQGADDFSSTVHCSLFTVNSPPPPICLLHCVTAYPAPESEYNLRVLGSLQAVFGLPVGVSDHSLDPELVPVLALCQGACVIEKHFCLSRSDPGLDDPIALPPPLFSRMVKALRDAQKDRGQESLGALIRGRGAKTIEEALGSGIKTLAPSEKANYHRTNRSLHAMRDIKEGEIIRAGDIGILRTEKLLRPGLEPSWEPFVYGRKARNFIPSGEGIRFEDI